MDKKLFNPGCAVVGCGAVLALSLLLGDLHAPQQVGTDANLPILPSSASVIEADTHAEAAAVPKRRRARASLSMPYFSFAQSLRPRG